MTGIVSYGTYIPYWRLKKDTAAQAYGKRAGKGAKAVAYCDEDSVTMAVAAAIDAVETSLARPSAVFFASATAPYKEKMSATEVAAALDLDPAVRRDMYICDYPPGYILVLGVIGLLGQWFETGVTEFMIKIPPIAADLLMAWFIYRTMTTASSKKGEVRTLPTAFTLAVIF